MGKTQKMLILSMIIVLIILICILAVYINLRRQGFGNENTYEYIEGTANEGKLSVVTLRNQYYMVEDCITKFYRHNAILFNINTYYPEESQEVLAETKKETANVLYNMLDKEYIESRGVTTSNIETKLGKTTEAIVDIHNMYVSEKSENIFVYFVEGSLRDKQTNSISHFKMIIKLDFANETFSIIPQDYVNEKYQHIEVGGSLDIEVPESIEANKNNKYKFRVISDETYAIDLFNKCKEELLYNPKAVYNNLDEEYKVAKASTEAEFEKYAKTKYANLKNINVDNYQKAKNENYTQYTINDKEGNYYIFREIAPMKYTLILDTYTIDIPEFTDRYNTSKDNEKVILNLNKFMLAINDKDYKTAYTMLADSFKKNSFKTFEEFEKYAKSNFFDKNKFDYAEFGDEAGTYYTYKINISDETGKEKQVITKTFIMLLGEGTKFEISFNLN